MSRQQADLMEMKYNGLLRHGSINVMSFSETAESYVFEINYSLKDLTGEELSRMFLSPTSPAMTVNSYRERITFRKSDSLRTRDELIYNLLGSDNDEISEISDFRYGSAEIKAPESVNESRFNMQMGTFSEFWTKYSEAKTDADFKQIAIGYKMPEFCKRTSNVLQCIDAYTAMTKDANGCGVLEGSQRDTCYYNFGTIDDKKHCESIADGTMRQDCLDKGKETEPGESGNTTIIHKAGNATEITNETVKDWIRYD